MIIIKNYKDYIDAINEGLIKTYPGEKVSKEVESSLIDIGINSSCQYKDDKIILEIRQFNGIDLNKFDMLFDHIFTFIVNRGGWFPSSVNAKLHNGSEDKYRFDYDKIKSNYKNYSTIIIYFEENFPEVEKITQ